MFGVPADQGIENLTRQRAGASLSLSEKESDAYPRSDA